MAHLKVLFMSWMIQPWRSMGRRSLLQAKGNVDIWGHISILFAYCTCHCYIAIVLLRLDLVNTCGEIPLSMLWMNSAWTTCNHMRNVYFNMFQRHNSAHFITCKLAVQHKKKNPLICYNVHHILCRHTMFVKLHLCYLWSTSMALLYSWSTAPLPYFAVLIVI